MKNKMQIELQRQLNLLEVNEAYSGFNGSEFDLGFQGEDLSTVGVSCAQPAHVAQPYNITFTSSKGSGTGTWLLFGSNRYATASNYGSTSGVSVTVNGGSIAYIELLNQVSTNPIYVRRWKFNSSSTGAVDLSQTVTKNFTNANGTTVTVPVSLAQFQDEYANNPAILSAQIEAKIDGNFYLQGTISDGTTLTILVWPESIVNPSLMMNNMDALQQYNTPVLSQAVPNPIPAYQGIPRSLTATTGKTVAKLG